MSKINIALTEAQYQIVKTLVEALRALFLSWLETADPSASLRRSLQATLKALDVYLAGHTIIAPGEAVIEAPYHLVCDPGSPAVPRRKRRLMQPSATPKRSVRPSSRAAMPRRGDPHPPRFRTKIAILSATISHASFVAITKQKRSFVQS